MKSTLLIWDIDGTLINPKRSGRMALDKAFHKVYGIENAFDGIRMSGRLDGVIVRDAFCKHNISEGDIYSFYDIYCKTLKEITLNENPIQLLPGVKDILDACNTSNDYYHVLGTGNMERGARIKLESKGLNKYFLTGGFGDENQQRWEIISKAIKEAELAFKVKFNKNNIYVVGDTPHDIESGKILGIKTIAVATGSHSFKELIEHEADHTLKSLEDTSNFLKIFA